MRTSIARLSSVMFVPVLAFSCGDPDDGRGDEGAEGGIITTITATAGNEGSGSASASGSATGSASNSGTMDGADGDTGMGLKFDLGAQPDASVGCGGGGGGGGGGAPDFSYIWIANSAESTVSKIDTQTLVEQGRYITRPDQNGNPSRTSVNLNGDMAIANRSGGVTMIYAIPERCSNPANTSTGAGDVKAWPDGCVGWHTPFAYASQRPLAWSQGEFDESTCRYENTKLWTSGANGSIDVVLMDGETGVVEATIPIPGVAPNFYGIYGGAVDASGNFWGSQLGQGFVVNVDRDTLDLQTWPMIASGYGMTVDQEGYVWTCSSTAARFDPSTETWQQANVGGGGGCMSDGGDILWMASTPLIGINRQTLAVEYSIPIPEYVHGVSIDYQGYVWGVSMGTQAYRVQPIDGTLQTFEGLVGAYTYSDMTGYQLRNAAGKLDVSARYLQTFTACNGGLASSGPAPLWAYLGGLSGAVTVMLTVSTSVTALLSVLVMVRVSAPAKSAAP